MDVNEEEVWITGFSAGVTPAHARLLALLTERSACVELPDVAGRLDLSWRFVKQILPELGGVVQPSSGPGHVDLRGLDECVSKAESLLSVFEGRRVPIAREKKGLVIGKNGANIKRLQELGVMVVVGEDGDDFVYIGGEPKAVEHTVGEIAKHGPTTTHPEGRAPLDELQHPEDMTDKNRQQRHYKVPCRFFEQGLCRYGEHCKFFHAAQTVGCEEKDLNRSTSAVLCTYFQLGTCRKGKHCTFIHAVRTEEGEVGEFMPHTKVGTPMCGRHNGTTMGQ